MSVINTNITSMIGQSNLSKSQNALQTSMERLSSGLRINSAKDDAAGQAIANRMTAQITGLAQAQRNANDGISIAQTAEGSLNQINDNLQRIRELSVQAANGSNSQNDLESIQGEIDQRLAEINRISDETDFNGVRVLAEDTGLRVQVGANDGQTIEVGLRQINAQTLGLDGFNVDGSGTTQNRAASVNDLTAAGGTEVAPPGSGTYRVETEHAAATFEDILGQMTSGNTVEVGTNTFTYNAEAGSFSFQQTIAADAGVTALVSELTPSVGTSSGTYEIAGGDVASFEVDSAGAITLNGQAAYLTDNGELSTNQGDGAVAATMGGLLTAMNAGTDGVNAKLNIGGTEYTSASGAITYQSEASVDDVSAELSDATAASTITIGSGITSADITIAAGGTESDGTYLDAAGQLTDVDAFTTDYSVNANTGEVTVSAGTGEGDYAPEVGATAYVNSDGALTTDTTSKGDRTESPLAALDAALSQVDTLRSELGAVQNRFEDAITNLNTNETNLSAARSRIEDADYAVEVANMTRAQILQQAGTSVLAQANQIPQNVLSLLG